MALKVNEIFYSIQGESSFAGRPCLFIRLTGCNLRCSYCDTAYAYEEGESLEISDILKKVASFQCPLVEITGGEPLIQSETPKLIEMLLDQGYRVLLETNGTQDVGNVDERCVRIMDIKSPSSGEAEHNDFKNLKKLNANDEIKFVLGDREDYDYAKDLFEREDFPKETISQIHFSPVFGRLEPQNLAQWILNDHLPVRLQLQLHKIIWNPAQRGV